MMNMQEEQTDSYNMSGGIVNQRNAEERKQG